jgi:hypothetical protein
VVVEPHLVEVLRVQQLWCRRGTSALRFSAFSNSDPTGFRSYL